MVAENDPVFSRDYWDDLVYDLLEISKETAFAVDKTGFILTEHNYRQHEERGHLPEWESAIAEWALMNVGQREDWEARVRARIEGGS